MDEPQPGFFLIRMMRRGPEVPARIWWSTGTDEEGHPLDRPLRLSAEIIDREVDPLEVWHRKRVPIPEQEFRYRRDLIRWARVHRPDMPECHPYRPVDMLRLPPLVKLMEE